MSHVDEGALHAYLDGALDEYPPSEAERIRAHLDGCAACADRLEEERRIRGDAHAFLDMASPVVEAPSFEELRAYVERTRPERGGISRLQRLGWAASVVLALGAGWMLREGQLQTRALDTRQDRVSAPASETAFEASPARAVADERVATDDERFAAEEIAGPAPTEATAVASAEPGPSPVTDRGEGAAAMPREQGVVVAQGAAGGAGDTPAPAETAQLVAPERADRDRPVATVVASALVEADTLVVADDAAERLSVSADVLAESDRSIDVAGSDSGASAKAVARETAAAESVGASVQASAAGDPAVTAELAPTGARAMDAPVMTSELRRDVGAPSMARAPSAPEADDSTAVALLAVPDHPVISVTNLGNGTTPWGVRVLQGLMGGGTFELFHLEPGVDPSILSGPAPGRNEARLETADGWIVARGPLSEAELAEMLQRLFPGAP